MAAKLVLFFKGDTGFGWSESYRLAAGLSEPQTLIAAQGLVQQRIKLLVNKAEVVWCRIQSSVKRDPIILAASSFPAVVGVINDDVNRDSDALLMRLESNGHGFNRVFLKGIPDLAIVGDTWTMTAETVAGFNSLKAYLTGPNNFVVESNVDNPNDPVSIVNLLPAFPRGYQFSLDAGNPAPPPFAVGDQVRVSGANIYGYNGVKTILFTQVVNNVRQYTVGGASPQVVQPNAVTTAKLLTPSEGPIQFCFIERATSHRSGRPFGLAAGRRRSVNPIRR